MSDVTAPDARVWVAEARTRAEKAHAEVVRLCQGPDAGRWRMRVPADPERDSDLLIEASIADNDRMRAALQAVLDLCDVMDGWGGASAQNAARVRHVITASLEAS